eukprot:SAG22_NODE_13300_length_411_cov_0.881410_2_plen_87_part_01
MRCSRPTYATVLDTPHCNSIRHIEIRSKVSTKTLILEALHSIVDLDSGVDSIPSILPLLIVPHPEWANLATAAQYELEHLLPLVGRI